MDGLVKILSEASFFYVIISFVFPVAVLMFLWTINKRLEMIQRIMLNKDEKEEDKKENEDITYLH